MAGITKKVMFGIAVAGILALVAYHFFNGAKANPSSATSAGIHPQRGSGLQKASANYEKVDGIKARRIRRSSQTTQVRDFKTPRLESIEERESKERVEALLDRLSPSEERKRIQQLIERERARVNEVAEKGRRQKEFIEELFSNSEGR